VTTSILRPDGLVTAGAGASAVGGTGTLYGVTSDNSDASYILNTAQVAGAIPTKLNTTTVSMAAGSLTKTAKVRARGRYDTAGFTPRTFKVELRVGGVVKATMTTGALTATITDYSGSAAAVTLTQAEVDAAQLWMSCINGGTDVRVMEIYWDLTYVTVPTTVAVLPTGSVTTTTAPVVTWTHTAGSDGGAQTKYQVKIFSAAQYNLAGFNADTSVATVDSGEVVGSVAQYQLPALNNNTAFRTYVRTAQTVNGVYQWAAWDTEDFTISVTPPTVSTVVPVPGTGSVAVTVNRNTGGPAWDHVTVERGETPTVEGVVLYGTSGNYLSSPDAAALDIVGDITLIARIAADDWSPSTTMEIVNKWFTTTNQRSYRLFLNTDGTISLSHSTTGSDTITATSTANLAALAPADWKWIAVTLDVVDTTNRSTRFWTSDDGVVWTQLGATVTVAGTTSIFSSSASLNVSGFNNGISGLFSGKVSNISIRNAIGASGTVPAGNEVFGFGPANLPTTEAATTFTASTGQTVTLNRSGSPAITLAWTAATWKFVRGASYATAAGDIFTITDYEGPNGVNVFYRAQAFSGAFGSVISGPWVLSVPVQWTSTSAWLKTITPGGAGNVQVKLRETPQIATGDTRTVTVNVKTDTLVEAAALETVLGPIRQSGVFHVIGSQYPVVSADAGSRLLFQSPTVWGLPDRWLALLNYNLAYLNSRVGADPHRVYTLAAVEVTRPPDGV